MRMFLYGFVAIVLSILCTGAQAEVFRCESPENGIVYQQTPCPEPEPEPEEQDDAERVAQDSSAGPAEEPAPERPRAEVEACKKQYRDAIDAIDLEISNSYSPEQREYYLGRLKALTEQMSAC